MKNRLKGSGTIRAAAVGMLTALTLTLIACVPGKDDGHGAEKQAASSEIATGGKEFGSAAEKTAKFGSDAKPGEFPRDVTHAMGTTTIASEPKRVVVLETGELDAVLALGVKPVGMATTKSVDPIPAYLADQVEDVETIGTTNELNIEKIAELKPDIIIGSQLRAEKLYPQLSEIAPTVFAIRPGSTWKENFLLAGEALGREKKAEEVMDTYDRAAADIKSEVKPGTTVSMVRFLPGKLRLYGHQSLIGTVLRDAGFQRPKSQDIDELAAEISPEEIDKAEADYLFYSSYGAANATGEAEVVGSNGWKNLSAVQQGRAHRVDDGLWGLGLGPIGATKIAQQLKDLISR